MTIKVKAHLSIGYADAHREQVIDVFIPESLDVEKREEWIEEHVQEWANNHISITWKEL